MEGGGSMIVRMRTLRRYAAAGPARRGTQPPSAEGAKRAKPDAVAQAVAVQRPSSLVQPCPALQFKKIYGQRNVGSNQSAGYPS
jgi:hypothetical protein